MDPYSPPSDYSAPRRSNYSPLIVLLLIGIGGFLAWRFFVNHGTPAVDPRPIAPRGDLAGDEKSTIDLFKESSPSVVFITTAQRVEFWNRTQEQPQGTGTGCREADAQREGENHPDQTRSARAAIAHGMRVIARRALGRRTRGSD